MSLLAAALRIATVEALRGQTLAGTAVEDSPMDPLAMAAKDDAPITLAVYTGAESGMGQGKAVMLGKTTVELVVQIYLPAVVKVKNGDEIVEVNTRQSGGELILDMIGRQVSRALYGGAGAWADLWRTLVLAVPEAGARPFLIETQPSTRLVAHELTFTCETVCEPPFGTPLQGAWAALVALMRANTDLAPLADWFEAEVAAPPDSPPWRAVQGALGLSRASLLALGLGPLDPTETGVAPEFTDARAKIEPLP